MSCKASRRKEEKLQVRMIFVSNSTGCLDGKLPRGECGLSSFSIRATRPDETLLSWTPHSLMSMLTDSMDPSSKEALEDSMSITTEDDAAAEKKFLEMTKAS